MDLGDDPGGFEEKRVGLMRFGVGWLADCVLKLLWSEKPGFLEGSPVFAVVGLGRGDLWGCSRVRCLRGRKLEVPQRSLKVGRSETPQRSYGLLLEEPFHNGYAVVSVIERGHVVGRAAHAAS